MKRVVVLLIAILPLLLGVYILYTMIYPPTAVGVPTWVWYLTGSALLGVVCLFVSICFWFACHDDAWWNGEV